MLFLGLSVVALLAATTAAAMTRAAREGDPRSPRATARRALRGAAAEARRRRISIELRVPRDLPRLVGDPSANARLVEDLVRRALADVAHDAELELRARADRGLVRFAVAGARDGLVGSIHQGELRAWPAASQPLHG